MAIAYNGCQDVSLSLGLTFDMGWCSSRTQHPQVVPTHIHTHKTTQQPLAHPHVLILKRVSSTPISRCLLDIERYMSTQVDLCMDSTPVSACWISDVCVNAGGLVHGQQRRTVTVT